MKHVNLFLFLLSAHLTAQTYESTSTSTSVDGRHVRGHFEATWSGFWVANEIRYRPVADFDAGSGGSVISWWRAYGSTFADGNIATGWGYATDWYSAYEAAARPKPSVGLISRSFTGEGSFRADSTVKAEGEVDLANAKAAAAAIGYAEYTSTVCPNGIVAVLTRSAAETDSNQLGTVGVSYAGVSGTYNVAVGSGTGRYPDLDQDHFEGDGDGYFFFHQNRSRSFIRTWANDYFGRADCDCWMWATAETSAVLW